MANLYQVTTPSEINGVFNSALGPLLFFFLSISVELVFWASMSIRHPPPAGRAGVAPPSVPNVRWESYFYIGFGKRVGRKRPHAVHG